MNSGVPWQLKGVRREAMETAREAARRAGMSVGEWLDTVITESTRETGTEPFHGRPDHYESAEDDRSWHRRADDRPRGGSAEPDIAEVNARIDALSRQVGDLTSQSRRVLDRALGRPDHGAIMSGSPVDAVDQALAEIEARQRSLDGVAASPPVAASPDFARAPTQQFPALEQQLRQINARIETMRPCGLDHAVDTLRDDLAEIGVMLKDAMPRQAIEALESEIRSLGSRIDDQRHAGADGAAIANMERGLAEVRDALRALTPAENLTGFDEAVHGLSQKIDRLADSGQDPATLKQLEGAIVALRGVVSRAASDEALAQLSNEVRSLAAKVDHITKGDHGTAGPDAFSAIERQIALIADTLVSQQQAPAQAAPGLEAAASLEAAVMSLADKIDGLHLARNEHNPDAEALKRDVQRTQDSLETVHGTLGHVVDRLATIETSIRNSQLPKAANIPPAAAPAAPAPDVPFPTAPAVAVPAAPTLKVAEPRPAPAAAPAPAPAASAPAGPTANPSPASARPIDPDLPPDHPLEPGDVRTRSSPSERIAASEAALQDVRPPVIPDPGGKSNFIAAARRAAQAAIVEAPPPKEKGTSSTATAAAAGAATSIVDKLGGKPRKAFVAIGAVLFILGALHFVMTRMWSPRAPTLEATAPTVVTPAAPTGGAPAAPKSAPTQAPDRQSAVTTPVLAFPPGPAASLGIPGIAPAEPETTGSVREPGPVAATPSAGTPPLPQPSPVRNNGAVNSGTDRLPSGIGGGLRAAAVKGDPAAEYEIASRYADGRRVPQNLAEAAIWFERAAGKGLVPAQFRLGGLYEKGMGVRKNIETARRLYAAAADAGHAKAMHNLAVLHAEGVSGKPDYQTAARWFRRAADHGVTDSQYNLAILYARGIGVETNLAEAFKWFALASREGDREAARRRDDVAGRLDKQSLAAAMAAAQAWKAQPQADAAVEVRVPAGGWDAVPTPSTAKRSVGPKIDTSTRRPAQ